MNNTRRLQELYLFPMFVWISQTVHCQVVRFELFLNLCSKCSVSWPQKQKQKQEELAHDKTSICCSVLEHCSQHLEGQPLLQRPLFATLLGHRFPKALEPAPMRHDDQ